MFHQRIAPKLSFITLKSQKHPLRIKYQYIQIVSSQFDAYAGVGLADGSIAPRFQSKTANPVGGFHGMESGAAMPEEVTQEEFSKLEKRMRDDNDAVVPQIAFSAEEYASRLSKLRHAMTEEGVDIVVLSSPEAQCWLHGYQARWYRTGSTTEWAPCNFTAVHQDRDSEILIPVENFPDKDDITSSHHTIYGNRNDSIRIDSKNLELLPDHPYPLAVKVKDGFLLFDSSDHKDLIQFTSIAKGFCHFDDPKHPKSADASVDGVHTFLLAQLKAQGWLPDGVKIGIEMWSPRQNAATTAHLSGLLTSQFNAKVKDITAPLRELQSVKSNAELNVMRGAAKVLDAAYAHMLSGNLHVTSRNIKHNDDPIESVDIPTTMRMHSGMTEIQVWAELEWAMAQEGGETAGLHNTVSRTRGYCHALSSTRRIGNGPLLLDPCAVKHRYHVNTARQFYLGRQVPPELAKASKIAADAIEVLHKTAKAGDPFSVVSRALQTHYQKAGIWGLRDWIGGYQLGIAFTPDWVGEFNWNVDLDEDKKIRVGLVTNFESFVGGAGFIDTVIFNQTGIEILSSRPREIQLIDGEIPDWWLDT